MASSYAALVSLQTLIHTIQHHPDPPISLHSHQVQSLLQVLASLQKFLELYSHLDQCPTKDLENLIKEAAYAAEDVIESCIVGRIETGNRQVHLFDLHSVIKKMDAIKKQALKINNIPAGDDDQQPGSSMSVPSLVSPSPPPSLGQTSATVGLAKDLEDILDRLTRDRSSHRQIIPIVGMGGIGKTTLAAKAYEHCLVKHHFDSRVWITISQNFVIRNTLLEIICQQCEISEDALRDERVDQIGERIHKNLSGIRYLIVMDDLWSIEAWNEIGHFFPDNCNGSKIVITTRLSNVATVVAPNSNSIKMDLLDEDKSWDLLCKTAFEGRVCPFELEELGKTIARNCNGLPLSIVVIGGFLLKSERTRHHWDYVARNLSSIVNLEDNKRCLKILQLSYRELPIHLKPCFLYMGLYREDERICVSYLVKLLVAEGFLKPIDGEVIEAIAEKYIQELVDRNLLFIDERGSTGSVRYCKIHDLLRDLCVREGKEENFLYVLEDQNLHIRGGIDRQRRIAVRRMVLGHEEVSFQVGRELPSASRLRIFPARSLKWEFKWTPWYFRCFGLLRILNSPDSYFNGDVRTFSNLRFGSWANCPLPCISRFWNLQTLIIEDPPPFRHSEIWKMRQLRHIKVGSIEFSPPISNLVLSNLQTLCRLRHFKCTEDVVERLPNIQKLAFHISYERGIYYSDYCLNNLEYLHKLEHLQCHIENNLEDKSRLRGKITFPHSLKKLTLKSTKLHWEDVTAMVGSLPNLESLKLWFTAGSEWRPTEGQFLRLKFLGLYNCDLEHWTADSSHFPVLKRLALTSLRKLEEIPSDIGEIPTLHLIEVICCNLSVAVSAKTIAEEQDALGNSELQIHVSVT